MTLCTVKNSRENNAGDKSKKCCEKCMLVMVCSVKEYIKTGPGEVMDREQPIR